MADPSENDPEQQKKKPIDDPNEASGEAPENREIPEAEEPTEVSEGSSEVSETASEEPEAAETTESESEPGPDSLEEPVAEDDLAEEVEVAQDPEPEAETELEDEDEPEPEPVVEKPSKVQTVGGPLHVGLGSAPLLAVLLVASPALFLLAWRSPEPWLAPLFGRFHILANHFPIALLLLTGAMEFAALFSFGRLRVRTKLLLVLGTMAAFTASAFGVMLREADGIEGQLMEWHFIGGLVVCGLALAAVFFRFARGFAVEKVWRSWYLVSLFLACAALIVTAHFGGSLVHGEDYLTEYAPWFNETASVREPEFPEDLPVGEWQVYPHAVAQILDVRCGACHNERNTKGGLVMMTWEGLAAGGKHGDVFEAGNADKSKMVRRMLLPLEDEDHMPPKKKPQPRPEEIELLAAWIDAGAPRFGTVDSLDRDGQFKPLVQALPAMLATRERGIAAMPEIDEDAVEQAREKGAAIFRVLQRDYPGVVGYESRQSADLHVNATVLGKRFGDDDLKRFASSADKIVWLDLTGTDISDDSARTLSKMARLRTLRLGKTDIGDETVAALADLKELESLSLSETNITEASSETLNGLPTLTNLYAHGTPLGPEPEPVPVFEAEAEVARKIAEEAEKAEAEAEAAAAAAVEDTVEPPGEFEAITDSEPEPEPESVADPAPEAPPEPEPEAEIAPEPMPAPEPESERSAEPETALERALRALEEGAEIDGEPET